MYCINVLSCTFNCDMPSILDTNSCTSRDWLGCLPPAQHFWRILCSTPHSIGPEPFQASRFAPCTPSSVLSSTCSPHSCRCSPGSSNPANPPIKTLHVPQASPTRPSRSAALMPLTPSPPLNRATGWRSWICSSSPQPCVRPLLNRVFMRAGSLI